MGQVSVTLNNRTYRLACNDGEESRLTDLARDVKTRVETLAREFGQPADERILLMAAVLLADELMDLREAHDAMLAAAAEVLREAAATPSAGAASKPDNTKPDPAKPAPTKADAAKSDGKSEQRSSHSESRATSQSSGQAAATGVTGSSAHPVTPPGNTDRAKSSAA
ncbi:MAG: cell division protein ZapA [Hyphomicrobium sp.]